MPRRPNAIPRINERVGEAPYGHISFFPGLNGLRFFAALLVVMHHSETILSKYGLPHWDNWGLFRNGGNAVTFFFVLSGFLITYILLREHRDTGTVAVGPFYLKRVLRIWPLYFLLVFIGLVAIPHALQFIHVPYSMPYTVGETWYWFIFFLPGIVTFKFGHHLLEPLWSIGVEEVYYLGWAPLFKALRRHLPLLLAAVVVGKVVLGIGLQWHWGGPLFMYLVNMFQFEAMAIGGLGAWLVFQHGVTLRKHGLFSRPLRIALFLVLVLYLALNSDAGGPVWAFFFHTPVLSPILVQLLFLHLILSVAVVRAGPIRLNSPTWDYLGGISYGIYMYHMLLVFACILLLKGTLARTGAVAGHLLWYLIVIGGTIAIAALSKRFYEDPFLRLKGRLPRKNHG